jgi:hypothetical protein
MLNSTQLSSNIEDQESSIRTMNTILRLNKNAPSNRRIITRMVVVFVFLYIITSCGFLNKNDQPQLDLSKLQLKEDIITFTFRKVPKIYSGLVKLNSEIDLIDKELERLNEIEAEFPKQKIIVMTEHNNWKKVKRNLRSSLSNLEKEVEKIYVTHLVNKNKSAELINKNMKPLVATINKALEAANPHTKRLIVVEKKSVFASLKDNLFG